MLRDEEDIITLKIKYPLFNIFLPSPSIVQIGYYEVIFIDYCSLVSVTRHVIGLKFEYNINEKEEYLKFVIYIFTRKLKNGYPRIVYLEIINHVRIQTGMSFPLLIWKSNLQIWSS